MQTKEYFIQYREKNRQKLLNNHKCWREKNKEKITELNTKYWEKNKVELNKKNLEWQRNNRDKIKEYNQKPLVKARLRATYMAKNKIEAKECEECDSKENLHRHHPNYNKPFEVMILCRDCHKEWHRNFKAIQPILNQQASP